MTTPTTTPPGLHVVQLTSATTLALLFGFATWTAISVMSSIITTPSSTNCKLSVFDGLIKRGNAVLHSVFSPVRGLAFLPHLPNWLNYWDAVRFRWPGREGERNLYGLRAAAMVVSLALQTVVMPKNYAMQAILGRVRERAMLERGRLE
jgi:hypothetical protein